ncbi:MAG TPA: helix-turn-helix domain-containing protein [Verrucomicrobiae bacterium]|nr:helix-turn-helix domain-containing protein [Verrucomicrobiae bacterium]
MITESGSDGSPLGVELRKFRELRGWTVEAAAKVTKIRADQIQDLENDNYAHFPSVACVRGFVRIYAKALGLDERRMVERLDGRISEFVPAVRPMEAIEKLPTPVVRKVREPVTRSVGGNLMGSVAVILLAIAGWVGWRIWGTEEEVPVSPPRAEVAQAAPASEARPAGGARPSAAVSAESATPPPVETPSIPSAKPVAPPAAVPVAEPVPEPMVENIPRAEPVRPVMRLELVAEEEAFVKVVVNGNDDEPLFDGIVGAHQRINCEGERIYVKARPASALMVSENGAPPARLSKEAVVQEFFFPR